ncbi:MAG TPA: flagellar basal body P-ring formation chaperone FlgA [Phenylobacterium sp.]|jgi:flagella basal body P-ring formation protein FlgA
MRKTLLLAAALASLASPAFAGRPVTLKADTANASGIVTLGDLFEDAGAAASAPVASRTAASVVLDAAAVQAAARRAGLDWANAEGLKKIVVHGGPVTAGGGPAAPGSAAARGNVEVLTYARSLMTGDIVQPTDLVWAKVAAAPADSPSDAEAVIGQAAKRPLRAGAVVQSRDIGAAMVIKAGDIVTVSYEADGVSLSMQGKAMGPAGVGETLAVQNTASKKVVQTVVTGPGEAAVGPGSGQFRAPNRSTRIAAR